MRQTANYQSNATESSCSFLLSEIRRQGAEDEASKAGDIIWSALSKKHTAKLLVFPRATKVSDRMYHKKQRNMHTIQSRKVFQKNGERRSFFHFFPFLFLHCRAEKLPAKPFSSCAVHPKSPRKSILHVAEPRADLA